MRASRDSLPLYAMLLYWRSVFLSSVLQVIFGFENFDLTRFITNLCINSAVSIITMILAMRDGKLSGENAKEGDYYEAKLTFKSVLKKIVSP